MKETIESLRSQIDTIFTHLHTHPEISWHEYETTAYIQQVIEKMGYSTKTFDDCPGLIAEAGSGDVCVAMRADMDALWQEVDGVFCANHSCGHDAHMTMVLGTMLMLKEIGLPKGIRLRWIFQPAEEKGQGALKMIEKGVLDDVDYLYGVHVRPIQEIGYGTASPAIRHGASVHIEGEIHGTDAHAARPQLGQNAIEVGAAIVHALQTIHLDPLVPYSVKVTKFQAGGDSSNIIPGSASFSLDLRAQENDTMENLMEHVDKVIKQTALLFDVKIDMTVENHLVAAILNKEAIACMEKAIAKSIGDEHVEPVILTPGGEDFHFYSLKKPGLKATMLGLGCGLAPGLHHPHMTFQHDSLYFGIEILTRVVLETAARVMKKAA